MENQENPVPTETSPPLITMDMQVESCMAQTIIDAANGRCSLRRLAAVSRAYALYKRFETFNPAYCPKVEAPEHQPNT